MKKIAIIGCKRIQDQLCVACEKCLKAMSKREGEFARYKDDDVELIALGNCGDCPGLIMPKVMLMNEIAAGLDREYDIIHLGTCVVKARNTGTNHPSTYCECDIGSGVLVIQNTTNATF